LCGQIAKLEGTKMLHLTTNGVSSYAQTKNRRFTSTKSNIRTIEQRWVETYNALPTYHQQLVDNAIAGAVAEFRRRNPNIKKWRQLLLAEAKSASMKQINIDGTMQRQLDIFWVLKLLNHFMATMVVPIQVYRPDPAKDEYLAWDGQHTIMLLWLIATQILGENPEELVVPVNLYHSNLKAEMRANFISLNSKEGKKQLELIDIFEQQVFGVRVDGSTNPIWVEAERKQQHIERHGLFVTAKKFGDEDQPGAITRLQEINKLSSESVNWLCEYLAHSTKLARPVEEKEMVMMAHFFDRCRLANIAVDSTYIVGVATVIENLFDGDFSPMGQFWTKAGIAYHNWHSVNSYSNSGARFNKEPVHGFPFLIAQLQKSFNGMLPRSDSKSEFWPNQEDLF
jgi:hypothetical protein